MSSSTASTRFHLILKNGNSTGNLFLIVKISEEIWHFLHSTRPWFKLLEQPIILLCNLLLLQELVLVASHLCSERLEVSRCQLRRQLLSLLLISIALADFGRIQIVRTDSNWCLGRRSGWDAGMLWECGWDWSTASWRSSPLLDSVERILHQVEVVKVELLVRWPNLSRRDAKLCEFAWAAKVLFNLEHLLEEQAVLPVDLAKTL